MQKRYFRVTSGKLVDLINQNFEDRRNQAKAWTDLCAEIGAKEAKSYQDGTFGGFDFTFDPDTKIYKQTKHGYWLPKKNCQEGKDLWKRIDSMKLVTGPQFCLHEFGLETRFPTLIERNRGWSPALCGMKGVWFVSVPWREEDPEVLEQYKKDRAAGTRMSSSYDHLLWEPPAEWEEIKEWQIKKEWEELGGKNE